MQDIKELLDYFETPEYKTMIKEKLEADRYTQDHLMRQFLKFGRYARAARDPVKKARLNEQQIQVVRLMTRSR